ncbi:hypothetical protein Tco_1279160, partial [Tanacetum coccineum]
SDRYFRIPNTSKDVEPSKKAKLTDTSKGTTKYQPKPKSTSKSVHAEETVYEAEATEIPQNQGYDMGTTSEQPNVEAAPKRNWFKKPARPPTPDSEWNICKSVDDGPTQNWLSDLAKSEKPSKSFNELMSTPIYFTAFAMNRLQISDLTKANLVGPVYNLLKGTCKSYVELEYNMEESDYFINNDLTYLQEGNTDGKYTTSITKTKAAKYELLGIEDMLGRNKLMCSHELYKFSDGTLISVIDQLKDMANNLEIGYTKVMPRRRWSNLDKKRARIMVISMVAAAGSRQVKIHSHMLILDRHIDEVLKLKNFKKDDYTSFQDQEKYEHVGPKVTSTQEGKISKDDDKRLCLDDDLKKLKDHIQNKPKGTSSSLKSKDHYAYHKLKDKDSRPRVKTNTFIEY